MVSGWFTSRLRPAAVRLRSRRSCSEITQRPIFALVTLAGLAGLIAIAIGGLIRILRTADELQRRINQQALAFAYVETLIVSLADGLRQQSAFPCRFGFRVCILLSPYGVSG
jgi:hypothetical protein